MQWWYRSTMALVLLGGLTLLAPGARADRDHDDRDHGHDKDHQLNALVSFGAGLNTEGQTNHLNHLIIPNKITISKGGVVHFSVGGFHQLFVYKMGTDQADIEEVAEAETGPFIDVLTNLLYQGIPPAGGPLMTPAQANPSNASNRMESVYFADPGTYLVICNVRDHFLDGMFAVVKVRP